MSIFRVLRKADLAERSFIAGQACERIYDSVSEESPAANPQSP